MPNYLILHTAFSKMTLRVGITGGIGSGKSIVAKVFGTLGVPLYFADERARILTNQNQQLKNQIIRHFGEQAYAENVLDRKYIASIVFNDKEKLALLNSLIHPVTIKDGEDWMREQTAPYAIKEAALIFETDAQQYLDFVIGVYAPQALRIKRVMDRDKIDRDQVLHRMKNQIPETVKMKLCDAVIVNDEQQLVIPQVVSLHGRLLEKVKS